VGGEGRLLVALSEIAVFDGVFRGEPLRAGGLAERDAAVGGVFGRRPRAAQAAYTPAVELLAPNWPPEPAETGKSESPRRTVTCSSGTPIISAAVWAMMV